MSISTRDKKILLMFSGVAVFAAGYFFGYKPQMSKAEEIETASVPLETRLNELLEMAKNKEFYVEETNRYNQEVSDYVAQFPADVKEEDGILLVNPGSLAFPRQRGRRPSYAVLETDGNGGMDVEIRYL